MSRPCCLVPPCGPTAPTETDDAFGAVPSYSDETFLAVPSSVTCDEETQVDVTFGIEAYDGVVIEAYTGATITPY